MNNYPLLIPNRIGSNTFHAEANSPPWLFPSDRAPVLSNISRTPTTQANAIQNHSSRKVSGYKKKLLSAGGVAFMVGGGTLIVAGVALFIAIRLNRLSEQRLKILERSHSSWRSHPIIATTGNIRITSTSINVFPSFVIFSYTNPFFLSGDRNNS